MKTTGFRNPRTLQPRALGLVNPVVFVDSMSVFPRIVRARSINLIVCVMRGQFEGALYSRARSIVRARSINFTVCVMRGLFETAHNAVSNRPRYARVP